MLGAVAAHFLRLSCARVTSGRGSELWLVTLMSRPLPSDEPKGAAWPPQRHRQRTCLLPGRDRRVASTAGQLRLPCCTYNTQVRLSPDKTSRTNSNFSLCQYPMAFGGTCLSVKKTSWAFWGPPPLSRQRTDMWSNWANKRTKANTFCHQKKKKDKVTMNKTDIKNKTI